MKLTKQIAAIIVLVLSVSVGRSQRTAAPNWTPPPPRPAKTPFAPKPLAGHNIFKGAADVWLADAIEKLECGIAAPLPNKPLTDFVGMVGAHVAKHSVAPTRNYQFIITVDESPRASTAGGGRVYISVGMLRLLANEDELAAMLAHEIAHDAFHHPARMVTRQIFWLTGTENISTPEEAEAALEELNDALDNPLIALGDRLLGFARFDELEADRAAFYNVYKAGYNPHAVTTALKRLERDNQDDLDRSDKLFLLFFGNHPPTGQRTFALTWESNFVKLPPKHSQHTSAAFDEMKLRLATLTKGD